jgi:hypothetical protein
VLSGTRDYRKALRRVARNLYIRVLLSALFTRGHAARVKGEG